MKITPEFAEIIGMFAADGCLQEEYICMWGNIYQEIEYYNNVVCPLFSNVLGREIIAHKKESNSVYGFYVCGKNIVKLFANLGFTNNKTYDVKIPTEILNSNSKDIHAAFIRGYVNCDGGIDFLKRKGKYCEFKLTYNTYPRIAVSSVSKQVINEMSFLLNDLGISHTVCLQRKKEANKKDSLKIMIRGPERVEDYIKKIGLNSSAHYTKYLIWKKFGMCPPRTTLETRNKILKEKLNPFSLYKRARSDLNRRPLA